MASDQTTVNRHISFFYHAIIIRISLHAYTFHIVCVQTQVTEVNCVHYFIGITSSVNVHSPKQHIMNMHLCVSL